MTEALPQHGELPAQIVVRPEPARYRARCFANGALAVALVVLIVMGVAAPNLGSASRTGLLVGGAIGLPIVLATWRWQVRTWLHPEPALTLQSGQFRIRHKGEFVWVPWSDVATLRTSQPGIGIGRVRSLIFELRPSAMTVLPARPAPLSDRLFSWHSDKLAYARPCDVPPFDEVVRAAASYFEQANK